MGWYIAAGEAPPIRLACCITSSYHVRRLYTGSYGVLFTAHVLARTLCEMVVVPQLLYVVCSAVLMLFFIDFFGENCELTNLVPCVERDDCTGHVTCPDPFGPPECLDGWTGDNCTDPTFTGMFNPDCPVTARTYNKLHIAQTLHTILYWI